MTEIMDIPVTPFGVLNLTCVPFRTYMISPTLIFWITPGCAPGVTSSKEHSPVRNNQNYLELNSMKKYRPLVITAISSYL